MIQAIGVDVVDIQRFEKIIERWQIKFIDRILTATEIEYCRKKTNFVHSIAARFAAKEAMIKCLSDNDQIGFHWHEMEIQNDPSGRPKVVLSGQLAERLQQSTIFLSMTHSTQSAIAMIVLECKESA
jgi:holo-[acyl-carrier protein] synthase